MQINQSITITSGIIIFHIPTYVLFIIDTNFAGKIFTLLQVFVANLWGALELWSKYGQVKRVIIVLTNLLPNCGQDLQR
jgi:hypothetical protein